MDTLSAPTFDFTAALWRFVRGRFASQAKQLRRLTEQPLAQCYDVLAISHGFSGWRGMSKVLDAMCALDRLDSISDSVGWDGASSTARLGLAVGDNIDDIHDDEGGINWKMFEQAISRPPALTGRDEMEVIGGAVSCFPLRASLFYKSAWLGHGAPWSEALIDEAYGCESNLTELWDGDEGRAYLATKALFGSHPHDRTSYWTDTAVLMAAFNDEVDRILSHKRARSNYLGESVRAYSANRILMLRGCCVDVVVGGASATKVDAVPVS